jgi:hypothetical protein
MSFGEPGFGQPPSAARQAWGALFWLLFVIDLCIMQYLLAFVLVTPFALMAAGAKAFMAWLPILIVQAVYAAGLVAACIVRQKRPLVMAALLLVTPVVCYGGWYLAGKAGLVPLALSPVLS